MIKVDIEKCTGCRRCETACAFFHTGRVNPGLSRIKVLHIYEIGIDGPVLCNQCQERYCLACPENALTLGKDGQVICSPTCCNLCGACEQSCPIGAIQIFGEFVYVCDLCGGRPKCVEACTENAIRYDPRSEKRPSLKAFRTQTKGQTPVQKQRNCLEKQGEILRKKWEKRLA